VTTAAPGRRERTKAANRAAILEAALAVFGELGYDAATVRDVIRRTDLASGTFYNYFPDKEAIFRALVEQTGDEARRRVRTARAGARSARGFVEDAYRAYFEFMVEDPATSAFLRRNAGTIPAFFGDRVVPQGTNELAEDLRAAMARGELPEVDVDYCAHAMIAVGLELGARMLDRDPPDVDGATRFATELFLGGMASVAAKPR
jgi:AcrR family transcriptional regulator